MQQFHALTDEYGPEKVVYLYEPRSGMKGIVVIDNIAAGPAIGGIRMAPDVTTDEVFRLARAMTWKNALAGLRHGGGKAGILADPKTPNKEQLIRHFAQAIEHLHGYIPGPDMGTDETAMAWVRDEIGRSVGLSKVLGGIPLDQVGATGFGIAICGEIAQEFNEVQLDGARVCHSGFRQRRSARGPLPRRARRDPDRRPSDLDGTAPLIPTASTSRSSSNSSARPVRSRSIEHGEKLSAATTFLGLDCDILVPAARPDVINETERSPCLKCEDRSCRAPTSR